MDATPYHQNKSNVLTEHHWANKTLTHAPQWCSVDLTNGNYALDTPLVIYRRDLMWHLLLKLGFTNIALGDIYSCKGKKDYLQKLLFSENIPNDICIQVDTTAHKETITKTFDNLKNNQNIRLRLCLPTSTRMRHLVLKCDKSQLIQQAIAAAQLIKEQQQELPDLQYAFCLEDFSATEAAFALDICDAVLNVWQPTANKPIIISLPASTDIATPNLYADQIEWFCTHTQSLDSLLISLYAANNRGNAVACIELGLLAGGQQVEGSLFGNGEQSGCASLITLALNLLTQGIDPKLAIDDMNEINDIVQSYTQQRLPSRQPYSGNLVFTTLDAEQREAIKAGLAEFANTKHWDVPYTTIDPEIIGRRFNLNTDITKLEQQYEPAAILEEVYGFHLPKSMRSSFNRIITDTLGEDSSPQQIKLAFYETYIDNNFPLVLKKINFSKKTRYGDSDETQCDAIITYEDDTYTINGVGNGPVDTLVQALKTHLQFNFDVAGYAQHALNPQGSSGLAITYIRVIGKDSTNGCWGVGIDSEGTLASVKALINALNRGFIRNHWTVSPENKV